MATMKMPMAVGTGGGALNPTLIEDKYIAASASTTCAIDKTKRDAAYCYLSYADSSNFRSRFWYIDKGVIDTEIAPQPTVMSATATINAAQDTLTVTNGNSYGMWYALIQLD